jgi:predicted nucleic acid-binding protein
MRIVLDANQFVSAVLVPLGHPAQILQAWREGRFESALSLSIVAEIRRVLLYPRLRKKHGWCEDRLSSYLPTNLGDWDLREGVAEKRLRQG